MSLNMCNCAFAVSYSTGFKSLKLYVLGFKSIKLCVLKALCNEVL